MMVALIFNNGTDGLVLWIQSLAEVEVQSLAEVQGMPPQVHWIQAQEGCDEWPIPRRTLNVPLQRVRTVLHCGSGGGQRDRCNLVGATEHWFDVKNKVSGDRDRALNAVRSRL